MRFFFSAGANVIITLSYIIILFSRSFYDFRLPVPSLFFVGVIGYNFRRRRLLLLPVRK